MLTPQYLKKNDIIRMVSPAGAIDSEIIENAGNFLKEEGFDVIFGKHSSGRFGRYSGNTDDRLTDLQEAIDDKDCRAILCNRGGYGTIHLLEKLDLNGLKESPKWIIGYSDITMLHSLAQKSGIASIHGGMSKLLSEAYQNKSIKTDSPSVMLTNILKGHLPDYNVMPHQLNKFGSTTGTLWGGNLAILYSLRGSKYEFIPDNGVLFIEDIGEKPYVVERMLYNLKYGGILEKLNGLIVGNFSEYEEDPLMNFTLMEIINNIVSEYNIPVSYSFPVGHTEENLPLICGKKVKISVDKNGTQLNYIA